jgi:hypothetical protein
MLLRISTREPAGIRSGGLSTVHCSISAAYATPYEPVPTVSNLSGAADSRACSWGLPSKLRSGPTGTVVKLWPSDQSHDYQAVAGIRYCGLWCLWTEDRRWWSFDATSKQQACQSLIDLEALRPLYVLLQLSCLITPSCRPDLIWAIDRGAWRIDTRAWSLGGHDFL